MTTRPWAPAANAAALQARAAMYQAIRRFFAARAVLEVDTAVLSANTGTDPHVEAIRADSGFLQTSPEFQMKRLLAAGSGPIYQIAAVFRDEEQGRWHEPEFRMLEWYRPGMDYMQLMDEVEELIVLLLPDLVKPAERISFTQAFRRETGLAHADASMAELCAVLEERGIAVPQACARSDYLDLIMGSVVGPRLGNRQACFLYDYPANQAALARVRNDVPAVAERFELYINGIELANGFGELTDAAEQRARFRAEQETRSQAGQAVHDIDEALLAALEQGLPECAGVALGLDRLLAIRMGAAGLDEVIAFPSDRA